jgi:hypothetical protein
MAKINKFRNCFSYPVGDALSLVVPATDIDQAYLSVKLMKFDSAKGLRQNVTQNLPLMRPFSAD